MPLKPRILVAPLDWGLGHATRCIPLIKELLRQDTEVVLAGSTRIKHVLKTEFPELAFVFLKGYEVRYSRHGWALPFHLASQIPKVVSAIDNEQDQIDDIVDQYHINAIISDNRYGLYHHTIPSVFMSHQLMVKTGLGQRADEWFRKFHYGLIEKFSTCWIPDHPQGPGLAGELSHPLKMPAIPWRFVGPLSRMNPAKVQADNHLLFVLSGPEPQRTLLEEQIIRELRSYQGAATLVRGLPGSAGIPEMPPGVGVFNHLSAAELNEAMLQADLIVARCGYSTVMDLAALNKRAVLIPTPGQTEQLYLARHLHGSNLAFCVEQSRFRLKPVLDLARNFAYVDFPSRDGTLLSGAVCSLLAQIKIHHHE